MSKTLEHIIRTILIEQIKPVSVLEPDRLDSKGTQFIQQNVCNVLNVSPSKVSDKSEIYGFYINIKERGGFPKVPGADTKEQNIEQTLDDVLTYIDGPRLSGVWAKNRTPDWYWFISDDLHITKRDIPTRDPDKDPNTAPVPKKNFKPKEERFVAKYQFQCVYVNKNLLHPDVRSKITTKTKGWLRTLKNGAMVFKLSDLNSEDWKRKLKTPKIGGSEAEFGTLRPPYSKLNFGSTEPDVKKLSNILNIVFFTSAPYNMKIDVLKFGCAHRECLKLYQTKHGLAVTGNYSEADRDNMIVALKQKAPVGAKDESNEFSSIEWNQFANADELAKLIQDIQTCQIENREVVAPTTDQLIVPEGGFKQNVTKDDAQFYIVQDLMIKLLEKEGVNKKSKESEPYKKYIKLKNAMNDSNNRGDYGTGTAAVVQMIKIFYKFADTDASVVTSDFIQLLKDKVK